MNLVPAKCPKCNAVLSVDPSEDATICLYCGKPFITAKAIQLFGDSSPLQDDDFEIVAQELIKYKGKSSDVRIPDDIKAIRQNAFSRCKFLKNVHLSSELEIIEDRAFDECFLLGRITLPEGLVEIGSNAFVYCKNLKADLFPTTVEKIGHYAFWGCLGITEVTFPKGLRQLGNGVFRSCANLKSIRFANGFERLDHCGEAVFEETCISDMTFPNSTKEIPPGIFKRCETLQNVEFNRGLRKIGFEAFANCDLQQLDLPSTVEEIVQHAFAGNKSISTLRIPASVSSIGVNAFKDCIGLREVIFDGVPSFCTQFERFWGDGAAAFEGCSSLQRVVIPVSKRELDKYKYEFPRHTLLTNR